MHMLDICTGQKQGNAETRLIRNHLEWAEAVILVDRGSFVGGWELFCGWAGKVVHPSIRSTPPLNEKGSFRVAPNQ